MRLSDESTAKFEIELVNKQVQKIKQAINNCQTHYGKQLGCGTCKALQLCTWTKELIDTIEALRKHIETLQQENNGWQERYYELDAGLSRLFKDFCKLQQENEQLRTQLNEWKYETKCHIDEVVAREKQMTQIKEALRKVKETINTKNKAHWFECDRCRNIRDALAAIDMLKGKKMFEKLTRTKRRQTK